MAFEHNQQVPISKLHRMVYSLGAAAYLLATLSTLPFWDRSSALIAYTFFLKTSSVLMITASVPLIGTKWTLWQSLFSLVGLVGQVLYFWSASAYVGEFNKGKGYIIGSFLVSLAVELRILTLIIKHASFKAIKKQKRYLTQLGLETFGSIFLLIGTSIYESQSTSSSAALFNVAGGVSLAMAASFLRDPQQYKPKFEADEAELEVFNQSSDQ